MGNFHLVSGGIILFFYQLKNSKCSPLAFPLPTRWIAKRKAMKKAAIKVNELII